MSKFKYVGTLPRGEWEFCLVRINGASDAVVVVETKGKHAPRMVIGGKLVNVEPACALPAA